MSVDQAVRDQYEALPYPARNPKDEALRLITGSPSHPDEIAHHIFGGRLPDRPLRILVAGGGTGDALVMLAQCLADADRRDEITYLDQSAAARAVAEQRLAARKLTATFITGSLLDVASLCPGPFDYIDCCGVLHHLDDPDAGLAALTAVLAPGGGMGLMVYGAVGRRGVYDMQTLLRTVAATGTPAQRVTVARKLLQQLPASNWLLRNPQVGDHLKGDAAGLFDLLLHARDRAYDVPEVLAWLGRSKLKLADWVEPGRYDPASYLSDGAMKTAFAALPVAEQWAQAELMAGGPPHHVFYAVRADHPVAAPRPDDPDAIPVFRKLSGLEVLRLGGQRGVLELQDGVTVVKRPLPPLSAAVLPRIDGVRSWRAIFADIGRSDLTDATISKTAEALVSALGGFNILLLRSGKQP